MEAQLGKIYVLELIARTKASVTFGRSHRKTLGNFDEIKMGNC